MSTKSDQPSALVSTSADRVLAEYLEHVIGPLDGFTQNHDFVMGLAAIRETFVKVQRYFEESEALKALHEYLKSPAMLRIGSQFQQLQRNAALLDEGLVKFSHDAFRHSDTVMALKESRYALLAGKSIHKSLKDLPPEFRYFDLANLDIDESEAKEAQTEAVVILSRVGNELTLEEAVKQIVTAVQQQNKPSRLAWLILVLALLGDWLGSGVVGLGLGEAYDHYKPMLVDKSPQAKTKEIQKQGRELGSPESLRKLRYVTVKVLIVRQNPRANSPELDRLEQGALVEFLTRRNGFSEVEWIDETTEERRQGWVFDRYLGKFK